MKRLTASILLGFALLFPVVASMLDFKQLKIDFTNPADAKSKATWSEPDKITLTSAGLGRDGEPNSLRAGWIQTEPYALGYSWRPTISASVKATVLPSPPPLKIEYRTNTTFQPHMGHFFLRYSPDAKHWSTWQAVPADHDLWREKKEVVFKTSASVPERDREEYSRLLETYSKLATTPWASDEDAAVRWMAARDPKLFARAIPFMGYIQFLYETDFYGDQRIASLSVDISYGMSGMHAFPKDKDFKPDMNKVWHYRAKE